MHEFTAHGGRVQTVAPGYYENIIAKAFENRNVLRAQLGLPPKV